MLRFRLVAASAELARSYFGFENDWDTAFTLDNLGERAATGMGAACACARIGVCIVSVYGNLCTCATQAWVVRLGFCCCTLMLPLVLMLTLSFCSPTMHPLTAAAISTKDGLPAWYECKTEPPLMEEMTLSFNEAD